MKKKLLPAPSPMPFCLSLFLPFLFSCGSHLSVSVTGGPPATPASPASSPQSPAGGNTSGSTEGEGAESPHVYSSDVVGLWNVAQTSSFLRFTIEKSLLADAGSFEILNSTTKATLLTATLNEAVAANAGYSLTTTTDGSGIELTIAPGAAAFSSSFEQGVNSLVAVVHSSKVYAEENFDVSIDNFPLFAVGYTYFPANKTVSSVNGGSLEGWSGPLLSTSVGEEAGASASETTPHLNSDFYDILFEPQPF